jgi:hypothetical protein
MNKLFSDVDSEVLEWGADPENVILCNDEHPRREWNYCILFYGHLENEDTDHEDAAGNRWRNSRKD